MVHLQIRDNPDAEPVPGGCRMKTGSGIGAGWSSWCAAAPRLSLTLGVVSRLAPRARPERPCPQDVTPTAVGVASRPDHGGLSRGPHVSAGSLFPHAVTTTPSGPPGRVIHGARAGPRTRAKWLDRLGSCAHH